MGTDMDLSGRLDSRGHAKKARHEPERQGILRAARGDGGREEGGPSVPYLERMEGWAPPPTCPRVTRVKLRRHGLENRHVNDEPDFCGYRRVIRRCSPDHEAVVARKRTRGARRPKPDCGGHVGARVDI